jgi:hypothetical protein
MNFITTVAVVALGVVMWWKGTGPDQPFFWFMLSLFTIILVADRYLGGKVRGFTGSFFYKNYLTKDSDISKIGSDNEKSLPNFKLAFIISALISSSIALYYEFSVSPRRSGMTSRFILLGCFFIFAKILMWILPKTKNKL